MFVFKRRSCRAPRSFRKIRGNSSVFQGVIQIPPSKLCYKRRNYQDIAYTGYGSKFHNQVIMFYVQKNVFSIWFPFRGRDFFIVQCLSCAATVAFVGYLISQQAASGTRCCKVRGRHNRSVQLIRPRDIHIQARNTSSS